MPNPPLITLSVAKAVESLLAGRLVAIPTETVYGLAADATNPHAVAKVFSLKGRPADHPLIVHCWSTTQAWICAEETTPAAQRLADTFWPGPLTLVVPRSDAVDPAITAGQDSVAIRVPGHPLTRQLLESVGRPLVAPSANRFGRVSPTRAEHVQQEFPDSDLLILDGGPCDVGIESTIIDCRDANTVRILRPGKITDQDLTRALGDLGIQIAAADNPTVKVSGALPSHYAPKAKVILLESHELQRWCESSSQITIPTFVISTVSPPNETPVGVHWHTVSANTERFAREMYALFRQADAESFQQIVVQLPTAEGIGLALRDRLQRAAH